MRQHVAVTHGLGLVWSQFGWNAPLAAALVFTWLSATALLEADSRLLLVGGKAQSFSSSLLSWTQVRPVKPGGHLAKNLTEWELRSSGDSGLGQSWKGSGLRDQPQLQLEDIDRRGRRKWGDAGAGRQGFSAWALTDILDQIGNFFFCCGRDCTVHCRMVCSIPDFYPLDVSSASPCLPFVPRLMQPAVSRHRQCPPKAKLPSARSTVVKVNPRHVASVKKIHLHHVFLILFNHPHYR